MQNMLESCNAMQRFYSAKLNVKIIICEIWIAVPVGCMNINCRAKLKERPIYAEKLQIF